MTRPNLKTHENIMSHFADSVSYIINEIDVNMRDLKANNRDNEQARYFRTRKILRNWFANEGKKY